MRAECLGFWIESGLYLGVCLIVGCSKTGSDMTFDWHVTLVIEGFETVNGTYIVFGPILNSWLLLNRLRIDIRLAMI